MYDDHFMNILQLVNETHTHTHTHTHNCSHKFSQMQTVLVEKLQIWKILVFKQTTW